MDKNGGLQDTTIIEVRLGFIGGRGIFGGVLCP
jgi:hypothetical protein